LALSAPSFLRGRGPRATRDPVKHGFDADIRRAMTQWVDQLPDWKVMAVVPGTSTWLEGFAPAARRSSAWASWGETCGLAVANVRARHWIWTSPSEAQEAAVRDSKMDVSDPVCVTHAFGKPFFPKMSALWHAHMVRNGQTHSWKEITMARILWAVRVGQEVGWSESGCLGNVRNIQARRGSGTISCLVWSVTYSSRVSLSFCRKAAPCQGPLLMVYGDGG